MVEAAVGSSEKAFIEFLVDYLVETNPGDLLTNLEHLSKHMHTLPPKGDANLYRKQYGNLKDCITQGKGIKKVFVLDGTCFKFRKHLEVCTAHDAGILTESAFARYLEGRTSYLLKHLNLMKSTSMNECKKCEMRYHIRGNIPGNCNASLPDGIHDPKYDFTKDPSNILNSEI